MDKATNPGESALAATLRALIDSDGAAALGAIGPGGISVAMPDSVPTGGHEIIVANSPLDVVIPEDRFRVIDAWRRVQGSGSPHVNVDVRLIDEPERMVNVHLLDTRREYGVFLVVIVPLEDGDAKSFAFLGREALPLTPRTARVCHDEVGIFLEVDEAISKILGWSSEELLGRMSLEIIHADDHQRAIDNWMNMLATRAPDSRIRLRHRHRNGSWVWMEITNHNLLDDPDHACVVADMVNVTDEMSVHEALRDREQLLDRLAEALPVGVIQIDGNGDVVYTNSRLLAIMNVRRARIDALMAEVVPADRDALAGAFSAALSGACDSDLEVRLSIAQSDDHAVQRRCLFSIRTLTADTTEVTGAIVCVADVTESAQLRDELRVRATFDDITKCHNRASTLATLELLLADGCSPSRPAVFFVDLDRFKQVNDEFGHAAGDELLAVVARRLQGSVRADDIVGRIGGDEFLVIRRDTTSSRQAMATARRIAATFRHQVQLKAGPVACSASIGVAWSSDPGLDAEALIAMADAAMYEAKHSGSDAPVLYRAA